MFDTEISMAEIRAQSLRARKKLCIPQKEGMTTIKTRFDVNHDYCDVMLSTNFLFNLLNGGFSCLGELLVSLSLGLLHAYSGCSEKVAQQRGA